VGVVLLSACVEGCALCRRLLPRGRQGDVGLAFHVVSLGLVYVVMLFAMTYSVEIFCAVILGLTLGHKRNQLIQLASGEIVAHFDDDNLYAPEYLSTMVEALYESKAQLDYVLALKPADFMERRLQTQVFKLGLAKSIHHARVLIRQRHIRVGKQIVNIPSFMVRTESQKHIDFSITSPFGGGRPGRNKRKAIAAKGGGGGDEEEDME